MFSFMRTGKDVSLEYTNGDDLKRARMAYVLHAADYILQDRERVFQNDMVLLDERDKDKVTLDNVFEIAKKTAAATEDAEDNDDDEEADEEQGEEEMSSSEEEDEQSDVENNEDDQE